LTRLAALVDREPTIASVLADRAAGLETLDLQAPEPLRPFVAHALAQQSTVLAVTATAREAEDLTTQLGELLGPDAVAHFPAWETLPHERLSPRSDTVGRRLAVLRRLVHPTVDESSDTATGALRVIVAPVRSILQPQVKGLADLTPVELHKGDDAPLDQVVRDLAGAAYSRVDLVERRGEFAVRGGIIDVFPPTEEHPLRIEFFGDEVEEIRRFAVADQRTLEEITHVWAPPCRELLLTDDVRARAAELAVKHPSLAEIFTKLADGHAVEGMESLTPVLTDDMEGFVNLLPQRSAVVLMDPERIRSRAEDLVATSEEFLQASWAAAATGGEAPIDLGSAAFRTLEDVRLETLGLGHTWFTQSPFGLDLDEQTRAIEVEPAAAYRGDTSAALADIQSWVAADMRVVFVAPAHGQAQRTVEWLRPSTTRCRPRPPGSSRSAAASSTTASSRRRWAWPS
jgi:transcription-repair coupling factor (superfamily II helicase)